MFHIEDIIRKMESVLCGAKSHRSTALQTLQKEEGNDHFRILVGTVLSARSRDERTTKIVHDLFLRFRNSRELSEADLKEIKRMIRSIGFYNVKAKRIKDIARIINEEYNGTVPETLESLLRLPGVGRKTANCVLVYGFNKPAIPVDVHVHRISNRLGIVDTKSPKMTEIELCKIIDRKNWTRINNTFVKFGQSVCLPRGPKCGQCQLQDRCRYYNEKHIGQVTQPGDNSSSERL